MIYKIDNRYSVVRELGFGFSGEVFLVEDSEGQKALKFLKPVQLNVSREEALNNFKNEFTVLSALNHPGIAQILDFGFDTHLDKYFFTTEFIAGQDFFKATEGKSFEQIEDLAIQVLRALSYLHNRGIYHLDIKPQNILVQEKNGKLQAKIIDFGLSGLSGGSKMVGTPAYMSPEMILGNKPDGRSDLYSFGILLYKAFTRENPFASKNLQETLERQKKLVPKPPSSVRPGMPLYWDRILGRLIEKKPSNRYAQASFAIRDVNFLAGKNLEIETLDTRCSYLMDKGRLIGRKKELEIFKNLFEMIFNEETPTVPQLLIIEGEQGTGKTRLLSEFKYISQLRAINTVSWKQYSEGTEKLPCIIFIDEAKNPSPDEINMTLQKISGQKAMIIWITPSAPSGWNRCEKMSLHPFSEQEIQEYLTAITGQNDAPQKLVLELYKRTQGNPLFLTELLRSMLENNLILDSMGRWASGTFEDIGIDFSKIRIPETLDELLGEKFQELSPEEQSILTWMAVYNRPLTLDHIREFTGLEKPQLSLLALTRADLIERTGTSTGFFFKNLLLKDVIFSKLTEEEKQAKHDQIATLLEKAPADLQSINQILWHRGQGSDTRQALKALIQLGDIRLRQELYSKASETYELAWKRSTKLDLSTQIATEMKLAESLKHDRNFKKAIQHYLHLKNLFDSESTLNISDNQRLDIFEQMGDLYVKMNAFDEALALFADAFKMCERLPENNVRRIIIENHIGNLYRLKGDVKRAEEIFTKNFEIWLSLKEEDKKAVINNRLTDTLVLNNKLDMAIKQSERDLQFFTKINNQFLMARTCYSRGDIYYRKIFYQSGAEKSLSEKMAVEAFNQCLKLAKSIEAHDLILRSYNGLGSIHFVSRQYKESGEFYQRALALARKLEEFSLAATLSLNLANIYRDEKNYPDAYSHLIYALNTLENIEQKNSWHWSIIFQCYVELNEVYRELGDYDKAEDSINKAGSLVRNYPHLAPYEFNIALEKSRLNFKKGNLDKCRQYLKKAQSLAKEGDQVQELKKYEESLDEKSLDSGDEMSFSSGNLERLELLEMSSISGISHQSLISSYPEPSLASKILPPASPSQTEPILDTILKINTLINSEHNPDVLLKIVLNYALELTGAETGIVLLIDKTGEINIHASVNTTPGQDLVKMSFDVAKSALQTGEMVIVNDAISDERFDESESVVLNELKSILCLPIRSKNKAVGVFYLDNRYKVDAFKNINQRLVQAFCDQVGIALSNAQLINGYRKEKKNLSEKLEATEQELSLVKDQLKNESSAYIGRYSYNQIISSSKPMRDIFKILDKVTETNLSVFLFGASGTGKELIARALHYNNPSRCSQRFIAINCGAIPANLMESELFGYKAGSFTGAQKDKKGLIEEASGGTLFLDEIGDLPVSLQVKLLRVLQEGEVHRLGDTKTTKVDVRVVCASHKPIESMIQQELFREDLFFRLCQLKIDLPSLSQRTEDIPLLAEHFIEKYRRENKVIESIKASSSFLKALLEYDWPGNIRELENMVSVACALRDGEWLTLSSLPPNYRFVQEINRQDSPLTLLTQHENTSEKNIPLKKVPIDDRNTYDSAKTWHQYEAIVIAKCFQMNGYKKAMAADMLDVSHSTLYKKVKELDLENINNPIYRESFIYTGGKKLKDYIPLVFFAALEFSDGHPYAAIRHLGVSQGYFYKVMKLAKKKLSF